MNAPAEPPPVEGTETLARFVFWENHIRKDKTVKSNAFLPPTNLRLSVFRHDDLSEEQLWEIGTGLPVNPPRRLHGRADFKAIEAYNQNLNVQPTAEPPFHANVIGWPIDKGEQKMIATVLARAATFKAVP
jgi:hypothetical protein